MGAARHLPRQNNRIAILLGVKIRYKEMLVGCESHSHQFERIRILLFAFWEGRQQPSALTRGWQAHSHRWTGTSILLHGYHRFVSVFWPRKTRIGCWSYLRNRLLASCVALLFAHAVVPQKWEGERRRHFSWHKWRHPRSLWVRLVIFCRCDLDR